MARKDYTGEDVTEESASVGGDQVEAKINEEQERGYRGTVPDPTPNENYTVAGVTAGKPTPETNADALHASRKAASLR